MAPQSSPYSHPDAPVRHSYPVTVEHAGLATAVSLTLRTLPYAAVRFGILLGFTVATIVWFVVTVGGASLLGTMIHPFVGMFWFVAGLGAYGWAWWFVVRYALYLTSAGHVAVLTELVTTGRIGAGDEGMFAYGKRIVLDRFGEVNVLFGVDVLVRGIVHAFNQTLNLISRFIPLPGLRAVVRLANAVVRAATAYITQTIFSYNLARGDENVWRSSKDALIYYGQNSAELLKTAIWIVVVDIVLTIVLWAVMLAPAFVLAAILPASAKAAGVIVTLVIAALLASNVRQAFLKPVFLVMIMTRYHLLVRQQAINLEWDDRLSRVSRKFGQLKDHAAGASAPPLAPAIGGLPR
jgi:hypothetical protein